MPILGTLPATPLAGYPTAGDILTSVQRDAANLVGGNNDALLDYVNRVQLEILRLSRWKFIQSEPQQFTTTANVTKYWLVAGAVPSGVTDTALALGDLDIIKNNSVVNRTSGYALYPTGSQPLNLYFMNSNQPSEWVLHPSGQLDLWPAPDKAYTIEFVYYKTRPNVTAATDTLVIPPQYKDVVISGVNYLVSLYLAKDNPNLRGDVAFWRGIYEDGKRQIVRDANLFPRVDYISPDGTSQRSAQSTVSIESSI